ncbi:hypothetical protein DFH09DRAFT_1310305 [Mycena vulgaris]|nr:hypothetical protein DFH09DRAFT_1310305 [Mycena vulgaris]
MNPISLLDLPNELLLIISKDLDDDGLLNLASTCESMDLLLTPGLLARYEIEVPSSGSMESISITAANLRILPALGIACFLTSVNLVDCNFTAYRRQMTSRQMTTPYKDDLAAIEGLHALSRRLRHFGHVKFNPAIKFRFLGATQVVGWSQAVATFLNSASQRGDCVITVYSEMDQDLPDRRPFSHVLRLELLDGTQPPRAKTSIFPPRTLLQRITAALESLFRGAKVVSAPRARLALRSTECASPLVLPFVTRSALTTFNIHSSFLFHTNFYRWTLHTLNTSPLTSLSLDCIDLLHYDWNLTLPALTLPALTTLAVGQCAIAVPDLALFLARHPVLHTLDLSFHLALGALAPPAATCLLPHLACLRATPDYLLYFLARDAAWHPALTRVGITSDGESAYEVAQFARVVQCLEGRRVVPRVTVVGKLAKHCQLPAEME